MKGKRLTAWLCTVALLAQAVLVGFPGMALEAKAAETVTPTEGETYYYNLADGAYFLSGSSITVNGETVASGTELTVPGDYTIVKTYTDREGNEGTITQFVSLYKQGDTHPDGAYDVKDLVAMKKYTQGIQISKAGQMAAEAFTNNADTELMQDVLLGTKTPEEAFPKTSNAIAHQSGPNSVMPIGGFLGPGYLNTSAVSLPSGAISDFRTDAIYALVADAGINLITATTNTLAEGESVEAVQQKELALAEKYGISMYVQPSYAVQVGTNPEYFEQYLKELSNYDSFAGISLMDEPWTAYYLPADGTFTEDHSYSQMSALAQMTNRYANLTGYTNLLPYWEAMGTEAEYLQYLEEYFTHYGNPKQLSFDYYVFSDKDTERNAQEYFVGLKLIKQKAQEHNVPFWAVVQAGNYVSGNIIRDTKDTAYMTDGMTRWTVHTALAYGAQGITYYPLVQPYSYAQQKNWLGITKSTYNYDRNGIIGADGTTTPYYEYIKNVNGQITAVDEVLMNAANCGVVVTENSTAATDTKITDYGYGALTHLLSTGSAGAMAGCFDYFGKNAYYAVNYDYNNAQDITLYFNGDYSLSVTVNGATEIVNTTDGQYTMSLRAGDGALVLVNGNMGEETGVQTFLTALANIPENAEMPKYYAAVAKAQTAYNSLDKIGKMNVSEELKNKLSSLVELASSYSPIYQLAGTQQEDAEYGSITVLDAPKSITDTLHKSDIPAQYGDVVFYVYNPTSGAVSATYNGVNVNLAAQSWTMVTVPVSTYGTGNNTLTFASAVSGQWKVTCYYGKNDANLLARVEAAIDALPEATGITLDHEAQVQEVRAMYEALSSDLQSKVANTARLVACENKIAALKLELSGKLPLVIPNTAYGVAEDVAAERNVYDEKYESVMSFADAEYFAIPASALTAEYQNSKSAVLYVYNPTEENAYIGVQLGDNGWIHRDRLTLYPQTWTAVDLFDRGQTYTYESTSFVDNYLTAGETVYFYAIDGAGAASTFAGDGWLVSGVYGMNQYRAGDQVVFDVVAAEGLDGTKTGYEIVNTEQFGDVFAFESTGYFILAGTQKSAEFKSCHDVVFYIYNPTDTDVTGYATLTWEYNVFFVLKANAWNRIVLANYAAAENTKFVASDTTIAFTVSLPKSEKGKWMMTNFYGTPNLSDDGSAAVVEGLINALPAPESLTLEHKAAVEAAQEAYEALSNEAKELVSADCKTKLTACQEKLAALDQTAALESVKAQIAALPEATKLTTADSAAVRAANEAYKALSEENQAQVVGVEKLTACVEKVAFWDKLAAKTVVDASYQVLGVDGTLTTGVDNNTFGKVMAVSNSTYLALTGGVKSENAAFRQSKNIGFYIYNPTDADLDGYYTMDWVYNAHFLLKAKAWSYIEFADFGAAANKQFITSTDTIYFYANMTGEGWLISSFYGESTDVAGLATVVDASYQVLGVDGTLTTGVDNSTFGKVMTVSGSTWLALTGNVKTENSAFKESKDIVFYIYNPTNTDVDMNYTMDWGYYAYAQLKANAWNRIHLSDLGAAANRKFITSNDTVYFYAAFSGEGWLVSSFYALPEIATEQAPEAEAVAAVNAQITALPEATELTTADSAAVWAASEAYNALSEENQAQVVGAQKLAACVEKVAFWDKLAAKTVVDASYQVLGVDGSLTTGVDNNTFGKVMAVSNSTYLALTNNVKIEKAAFRQSKNIGFYIYNPTDADVDGYYTMDWVYNAHFLLKAKAWSYIEFADFGSAANKQFITSTNTVYFYANMTGEGWLISSFYGESTDVEGLATVVDASYQVLGVDGTLTTGVDNSTFGKVMTVSGSTYLALTPNVKTGNPAFKESKDIVFYIYNPTDTDVDLNYTMDWGYYAYAQLKANAWNRIHLSDLGAAANKQFITSNDTVYFYAAFSGEGWLVSSFYALPDMG